MVPVLFSDCGRSSPLFLLQLVLRSGQLPSKRLRILIAKRYVKPLKKYDKYFSKSFLKVYC